MLLGASALLSMSCLIYFLYLKASMLQESRRPLVTEASSSLGMGRGWHKRIQKCTNGAGAITETAKVRSTGFRVGKLVLDSTVHHNMEAYFPDHEDLVHVVHRLTIESKRRASAWALVDDPVDE